MVALVRDVVSTFFFSGRRRHTRSLCDWSSDVCSSDLVLYGWSLYCCSYSLVPVLCGFDVWGRGRLLIRLELDMRDRLMTGLFVVFAIVRSGERSVGSACRRHAAL